MRKFYGLLTGLFLGLVGLQVNAGTPPPDSCHASFTVGSVASNPLARIFTAIPWHNNQRRPEQICWHFGDGHDTCINYNPNEPPPPNGYTVIHQYGQPGNYYVCVAIHYQGGCLAYHCDSVPVLNPVSCTANFQTLTSTSNPLAKYFIAQPWHSQNKKPIRVCWIFGDGHDTCINYATSYTGTYAAYHVYSQAGNYNVCVNIRYDGGCEAQNCHNVLVGQPDSCTANFETIASTSNPLAKYFIAQPWHSNNKKPIRVCWIFGDGHDTCINYSTTYTGPYAVFHLYAQPGTYNVCVHIRYDGGCEAQNCHNILVSPPDSCQADLEKLPIAPGANPLSVVYRALPWHNNNKKPQRICWNFGDGHDTCVYYLNVYNGQYTVAHTYSQPGLYNVCVNILYFGGCEAHKCRNIQVSTPDSCSADFERIPTPNGNPLNVYLRALPWHNNNKKPQRVCWNFGDGHDTCINYTTAYTGQYVVAHHYQQPGTYNICVNILYFGGCEAHKCRAVQIGTPPDSCSADFERIASNTTNPLRVYFRALPWHNNNKKPQTICWHFGDGHDTCINYTATYTGQYVTVHNYQQPGTYNVCVHILYFGGCEANKCRNIQVGPLPDSCTADFERLPNPNNNPLNVYLRALPWNSNNNKPQRICWNFGDGHDTCIYYTSTYTGQYVVNHHYQQPGSYNVCVNILYFGGCEAHKCRTVVIPQNVTCSVHLFEITPSITSLVRGFFASPSSNPNRRPEHICWHFGDGHDTCYMINPLNPLPSFFILHTYPGPGVYHACVQVTFEGGCVAYDCREVVIQSTTNVCGGYMTDSLMGPRTYRFKGFSIHNPNDEAISYHWTFGDGSSASGREVTHTYSLAGNYEVCLNILTRLGCVTRICKTIHVPGTNQSALQLSPNPVINIVHVDFFSTHTEQVSIKIINSNGIVVRNYVRNVTAGPNSWNHDLSTLPSGIYSFVVQSPNQLASAIFLKL